MILDDIKDSKDLAKVNKSNCDDFLAQTIFYKIDHYAFMMACSLHNATSHERDKLPYLILCLEDEISNRGKFQVEMENLMEVLDNSSKIFAPPNTEYRKVGTMKTYPKFINCEAVPIKVHFNPYVLALYISDLYFTLYSDQTIESWCDQGLIKFESIDKIFDIIKDKYSYRFEELANITFETMFKLDELDNQTKIEKINQFLGFTGTDLLRHYLKWKNDYYSELLNVIKSLFGKLSYS